MTYDEPASPDPRDRRDDGLQDARDDSEQEDLTPDGYPDTAPVWGELDDIRDCGTLDVDDDGLDPTTGAAPHWRDR